MTGRHYIPVAVGSEHSQPPVRIMTVRRIPFVDLGVVLPYGTGSRARCRTWMFRRRSAALCRRVVGIVAAIAQLVLVVATGAESWHGSDASAHVEKGGVQLHYAHDAASCVACTAQSLHAAASPRRPPVLPFSVHYVEATEAPIVAPSHDHPSNGSRAPPR
jgi:hypothetical protein